MRLNKNNKIQNIIEQDPQKYYLNLYEVSSLVNNTTQDINQGIFSFKNNNNSKNKNNNKNLFEKMNNLYLRRIEERQKSQNYIMKIKEKKQKNIKVFF